MENKAMIYNFGPDGSDACWAALTSSWTRFSKQQGTLNSWPVKSRRPTKKKKQNVVTATTTSRSPPPRPLPPASPKALKRRSGVQLQRTANEQLSSSAEVMEQTISEPPLTNGPCNCSQSVNSELPAEKNVTGNNNNNDDDVDVDDRDENSDRNKWKCNWAAVDVADQERQQLMLCAADSGSSTDIKEPATVYAEQPIKHALRDGGDRVSSASRPPTPSTAAQEPIEHALRDESDHVSSASRPPNPSTVAEQPDERSQQIVEGDRESTASSPPTTSFAVTEKLVDAEHPATVEVCAGYREVVSSPTLLTQFPLQMTLTADAAKPMVITVVPPPSSLRSQLNDNEECPVQPNLGIIVFSEKPLSKYEMKIKEIDNSIISYSKSFLSTVLFVVLLRVLF
ncbi:uncharacterized protein LOC112595628 isoform X2 [Melanaphis sacchari]|uniref:uncharacterized protein LOC112595628 isoform X2 n=1 Tax=Melanaphis sacchari TaxID=742174 RepID=UPI000DC132B5|nr:uncharacterized protein LOC112595628 isoform X2 [Melanaphis sacchari]